jgi:hypothetical protein
MVDALSSSDSSTEKALEKVRLDDGRRLWDIGLNPSNRTTLMGWKKCLDIVADLDLGESVERR